MPATQPTDTRQGMNTDKAAEALHYFVKLNLLGQKMVGIGASQEPQSESPPESRLSYPTNTINLYGSAGACAPQSYPNSHFCLKKLLVLRESWLKHAGTLCKGLMEAWWRWSVPCVLYSGCADLLFPLVAMLRNSCTFVLQCTFGKKFWWLALVPNLLGRFCYLYYTTVVTWTVPVARATALTILNLCKCCVAQLLSVVRTILK